MDKDRISKLTLEEKTLLTCGDGQWRTRSFGDIPTVTMSDGPHGLRKQSDDANGVNDSAPATCFPTSCAVASSWNVKNAERIASCIADEAIGENVSLVLGPGVNIKRSPLCGRNFEYFSEDPVLAGRLAGAYVKSMQSRGVGSCLKHFAVNSQETRRMTVDAIVDERALREIYLAAFEYVVKDANPFAVMASYNKINGSYATQNRHLFSVLRDEWHFDGVVMSDWGACYNTADALSCGMDLEMPEDKSGYHRKRVVDSIKNGKLDEGALDKACLRIATLADQCSSTAKNVTTTASQRHAVCREVAADSAVLLKNNGLLPLTTDDFCVVGELAEKPRFQGAGSSHINARCKNFLDVLSENGVSAEYAKGYVVCDDVVQEKLENEAVEIARKHQTVLFFGGLTDNFEGEGYDRKHLDIPSNQQLLLEKIHAVNPNIVFIAFAGSPFVTPWLDKVACLLDMYLGGEAVMEAAFDLIFGRVSPSGRLAETFPLKLSDTPCFNYFANDRFFDEHRESIFVGYRYYNTFGVQTQFPFGYGLSYSTFRYGNLQIQKEKDGFAVFVTVENLGNAASEVVQLYVDNCSCGLMRPKRELKAFAKVSLQPKQSVTVEFHLSARDFSVYQDGFVCVNGKYGISVCKNVEETLLSQTVEVDFGVDLTGDDSTAFPDYFRRHEGTFTVSDEQFFRLANFCKKEVRLPKRGEFTLLNTLEDMSSQVGLIRLVLNVLKTHAVKHSSDKSENNPVVQMIVCGARETPLISMMSIGNVDAKFVKFLLYHANRQYGKAFCALLGKYEID